MDLFFAPYTLTTKFHLNSLSKEKKQYDGILIKYNGGYASIHPWVEFGDPSLKKIIHLLQQGDTSTPLIKNALECTRVDGTARLQNRSLFLNELTLRSHASFFGDLTSLSKLVEKGFQIIKFKIGRNVTQEALLLNKAYESFPSLRWRLDANGSISPSEWKKFFASLSPKMTLQIDFIEDANFCLLPYNIANAADRIADDSASWVVIKPAVDNWKIALLNAQKQKQQAIFTSYMDHPIGQCYAAWISSEALKKFPQTVDSTGGLMTHSLFTTNPFSSELGRPSPRWKFNSGTGLGFDHLLKNVSWKKLSNII